MLVTTQWPLKRVVHLTPLVWVCVYAHNVYVSRVFRQSQVRFWKFHRWYGGLNRSRDVERQTGVIWHDADHHILKWIPSDPAHITLWILAMYIWASELDHHWYRQWLFACSAPSHFLVHCLLLVNWTLRNNHRWKLDQSWEISDHDMHRQLSSWSSLRLMMQPVFIAENMFISHYVCQLWFSAWGFLCVLLKIDIFISILMLSDEIVVKSC